MRLGGGWDDKVHSNPTGRSGGVRGFADAGVNFETGSNDRGVSSWRPGMLNRQEGMGWGGYGLWVMARSTRV